MFENVLLRVCLFDCTCACVYAWLCGVSGVLKVWPWLLTCYCMYACVFVCVHLCMRVWVYVCDVSDVLMYGGVCYCVDACMCACVLMCLCVYACIFDVYCVLSVL